MKDASIRMGLNTYEGRLNTYGTQYVLRTPQYVWDSIRIKDDSIRIKETRAPFKGLNTYEGHPFASG